MGERDNALAHAVVGEQWLDKHLEKVGKTKQELARFLYKNRLTAVADVNNLQYVLVIHVFCNEELKMCYYQITNSYVMTSLKSTCFHIRMIVVDYTFTELTIIQPTLKHVK